jgi:hypothetical protein
MLKHLPTLNLSRGAEIFDSVSQLEYLKKECWEL